MEKIFERVEDLHVRAVVVYGKTADKKLYLESDYKTQAAAADVEKAFKLGALLVNDGTNLLVPVSFAAGKVKTVGMGASAVELTEWAAKTAD